MELRTKTENFKLGLSFCALLVVVIAAGIFSIVQVLHLSALTDNLYNHPMAVSNAARDINTEIIAIHRDIKDIALDARHGAVEAVQTSLEGRQKHVRDSFDILQERYLGDKMDVNILLTEFKALESIRNEVIALVQEGRRAEAIAITTRRVPDHVHYLEKQIEDLLTFANSKGQLFYDTARTKANISIMWTAAVTLLACLASLLVALFMIRIIHAPLLVANAQAGLAESMRGEQDIQVLSQNTITFLAKHFGAPMASLYLLEDSGESLLLSGSYAFNKQKGPHTRIQMCEGIAGQAAYEKNAISVLNVPEDYPRISSTLGNASPNNILALPFVYDGQLVGVAEFASFKEFSDAQIDFWNSVAETVAIVFVAAENRRRMQKLLEETQRQSEELEAQTEELQGQQEELRTSNENLEQQSEELRVSNEEMEEKTEALEQQKLEIEERTREVERAKLTVEEKVRELEKASKYKSEFLANMSHELRTPLNSLLILAKLLADNDEGNLTEGQMESARVIQSGGQDLLFLINEILDLSKVEAGMMEIHYEEVLVEDIVNKLHQQFDSTLAEKGLEFKKTVSPETPSSIVVDKQRLGQVLRNFFSNAVKFTAEGSVGIEIGRPAPETPFSCEHLTPANTIAFSVHDTGFGIPADKQATIFEAFRQADGSTSRQYGGTGLGLSISRALAHLLNGEIHLESQVGAGSTFTLYLPLERRASAPDNNAARDTIRTDHPQRRAVRPAGPELSVIKTFLPDDRKTIREGDRSVLIIEDDPQFSKILMSIAHKKGFKCIAAGDGNSGLKFATDFKPTAILLDLGLPDIDGIRVLDRLKYDLATRHIPVHVMSARDMTCDIMQKGAVGYLTKPIDAEDIDAALSKIESIIETSVKTILIVEDDANSRKATEKLLMAEGVEITGVGTGQEASEMLANRGFDCMILDLGLPDMTGFELLEKLEASPAAKRPPTVIYTGKELTSDEVRELGRYTANVVIKGADSPERLLDETSLFLHLIESSLPKEQKKMLRMLHDSEQLLHDRTVLLVDDDLRNSFALSKILKKAGLSVVMAENGQAALNTLEENKKVDLVLMDIMMPIMDGYEAMAKIRKQPRFEDLPIVALTAKAMVEDRAKCIQAGANDYLAKPIDVDKLISLMRVLLYR